MDSVNLLKGIIIFRYQVHMRHYLTPAEASGLFSPAASIGNIAARN